MRKLRFLILPVLMALGSDLFGQCCAPGNPVAGANQVGILPKYTLRTATFYRYSYSNTYYDGTGKAEYQGTTANYNYLGEIIGFGLPLRFTAELELGYYLQKSQDNDLAGTSKLSGPANGVFTVKYGIIKTPKLWELTIGAGMKFPFTQKTLMDDQGIAYPPDMQPSTGAFGYVGQLFLAKGFLPIQMKLMLINRVEVNGKNKEDYHYGTGIFSSFFITKTFLSHLVVMLQYRNEYRWPDKEGDIDFPGTGGDIMYVCPQVAWSFPKGWAVSANCDLPVWRDYNGFQLGPKIAAGVTLVKDFNLVKKKF